LVNIIKTQIGSVYKVLHFYLNRRGERFKRVLLGSSSLLASTFIRTITRMAIVTLIARLYTREEFGIWVTITSISAIFGASDLGISNALRNKLSSLRLEGEKGNIEAREYYLSVLYFVLAIVLFLSFIIIVLSRFIPLYALFKTPDQTLQQIGARILLAVQLIILLGMPFSVGVTCFYGYQESHLNAIIDIARTLLGMILVFFVAITKHSIVSVSVCSFLMDLLFGVIGTIIFLKRRRWNPLSVRIRLIFYYIFKLVPQSLKFGIVQIAYAFISSAATITISATIGVGQAAEYNLVQKLYSFVIALYQSIFNPLWAGYSDAANHGDWGWCKKTLKISMVITAMLFVLTMIVLALFGNFFLTIWVGKKYISQQVLFLLLGFWALVNTLAGCASLFQNALGRIELTLTLTVITAIVAVSFLSAMGRTFGLIGIATGITILLIPSAVIIPIQAFSIIKANLRRHNSEEI